MQRKTWLYLRDAAFYGGKVVAYLHDVPADEFVSNDFIYRTTERYLEIIGECITIAVQREPDLQDEITNTQDIRKSRNLLAHGYWSIQPSWVYEIAKESLPTVIQESENLPEPAE